MKQTKVLVVGVGGLGKAMMHEALARGLSVSILARDQGRLEAALGPDVTGRLAGVTIGDGTDQSTLDRALPGMDVVLSGRGADPTLAASLSAAIKRHDVGKLCWPAGTTNVLANDGVTPNYQTLVHLGAWVEPAFRAHGACIDAIRESGVNHVIFCPGRMGRGSAGQRSEDVRSTIRINRDGGPFVSYEDAGWVMLEGAVSSIYDGQLVSAGTTIGEI